MTVSLRSCCLALKSEEGQRSVGILEITVWKLLVTSLLCLPYALLTEGFASWSAITSRELWADPASAALLIGSVCITTGFQFTTVGVNAGLRSPLVAVLLGGILPK